MKGHRNLFDEPSHVEVLVDRPARSLDRAFTYAVPQHLHERVQVGSYVLVPFGQRQLPGFVTAFTTDLPDAHIRNVQGLLLDEPLFTENDVALAQWLAQYYVAGMAEVLRLFMPPGGNRTVKRIIEPTRDGAEPEAWAELYRAPRQRAVIEAIQKFAGAVEFDMLIKQLKSSEMTRSMVEAALNGLRDRGYITMQRQLKPPAAQPLERQMAYLVEGEADWEQVIEQLQQKAPRQADVVAELWTAETRALPVAALNRSAVLALEKKNYVRVTTENVSREPQTEQLEEVQSGFWALNPAQGSIFQELQAIVDGHRFGARLIHGVTGSGKTEVYLHIVAHTLSLGRDAVVLVPEISLTPQMIGRFRGRFGDKLAVMHSALGIGERFDEWQRLHSGEARVVVGARSALFAPMRNLGIVIVDEEHDNAYKQGAVPRYHAVRAAFERARLSGALLLLGSATPSIERYYEAQSNTSALQLLQLPERVDSRPLPEVRIIDLRGETVVKGGSAFSRELTEAINARITAEEQVMLLLNRRGFSTFVICKECGHVERCPECDISLTYHHASRRLRCHHCDFSKKVPETCQSCEGYDIGFEGLGTERVADQLQREFTGVTVARMDRDTIGHKGAHGQILKRFASGEVNILVGTQMIAKGHDFPNVTLVGVLNADTGLHRPDFRAAETTFQLLTQVAGRAGRAGKPGEVLIQTYNPDHYAVTTAAAHDYDGFYRKELAFRKDALYPPFVQLVRIVLSAEDETRAYNAAHHLAGVLGEMGVSDDHTAAHLAGPAEAPLHRLRGRYRYSLLLKGYDESLSQTASDAVQKCAFDEAISVVIDVDPLDMM